MGLDHIEWSLEVEDEFEVKLDEQRLERIVTPRQMAELVMEAKSPDAPLCERERILQRVIEITAIQTERDARTIRPDDQVVHDLGMD